MGITPIMLAENTLFNERMRLARLQEDPFGGLVTNEEARNTEINVSKLEETMSILNKHYAKRNAKQHLVDQMGPPNMKDLKKTAELPRGRRIVANTGDYPIEDGDGVIRKNIKSYLGGKKTRRLRTKLRGGTKSKGTKGLNKRVFIPTYSKKYDSATTRGAVQAAIECPWRPSYFP